MTPETIPPHKLTLLYADTEASTAQMKALAQELKARGHQVNLDKQGDGLDLPSLKEYAEQGFQKLTNTVRDAIQQNKNNKNASPFDEIGPQKPSESDATITTDVAYLSINNTTDFRIGLLPKTELSKTWQPDLLDAIVIPNDAFKPYLLQTRWNEKQIFTGGYIPENEDKTTDTPDNLRTKFGINSENGPVILIFAADLPDYQLTNLFIQLSTLQTPYQAFFHYGENQANAQILRTLAQRFGINARMFGNLNPFADYIGFADLALCTTASTHLHTLETLGIPTLTVEGNSPMPLAAFLQFCGASISIPNNCQFSEKLQTILRDKEEFDKLKKAADQIAKTASVILCADAIEDALRKKSDIHPLSARTITTPAAQTGFEVIGAKTQNDATGFESIGQNPQTVDQNTPNTEKTALLTPAIQNPNTTQGAPLLFPEYQNNASHIRPIPTNRSKESMHDEMSQLILIEKMIDKQLDITAEDVLKYEMRLDLARQSKDENLIQAALATLEDVQRKEKALFSQKRDIAAQKNALKLAYQNADFSQNDAQNSFESYFNRFFSDTKSDIERKFDELERKNKLAELYKKLRKDRGY